MPKVAESYVDIIYDGPSASGKSKLFTVVTADGTPLGTVKWYGAWRCYAFFPKADTLYEKRCLRDIANFCEKESHEQLRRKRDA